VDLIRDVYSEAWSLYKTHWRHLLTLAFVVYLAVAVIGTLLVAVLTWLGALIAALIALIALFWLQAALVKAVEDVRDGRADMSLSETFEAARAHLAAVFVAGFIAVVGVGVGLFLLIIPGLVVMTFCAVIVPAIVIEGRSAGESLGRSFDLTRPLLGRPGRGRPIAARVVRLADRAGQAPQSDRRLAPELRVADRRGGPDRPVVRARPDPALLQAQRACGAGRAAAGR
jgi:hypothetical protein